MVSALSGGTHPAVTDWERISVIFLQRQNDKETNINPGYFYIHAFHCAFYSHKDPKSSLHKIIVSWLSEGSHDFVALFRALPWDEFVWKMSAQLRGLRKEESDIYTPDICQFGTVVAVLTINSYGRIQCLLKYKVNTYLCVYCKVKSEKGKF